MTRPQHLTLTGVLLLILATLTGQYGTIIGTIGVLCLIGAAETAWRNRNRGGGTP